MPDLTPETLAELRRLAEAATPRPWSTVSGAGNVWHFREEGNPIVVAGHQRTPRVPDAILIAAAVNLLPALLNAAAERDALAAKVERLTGELVDAGYRQEEDRAELGALRAMLAGRCLSGITHRDEEHRQSVCMLPEGHAPLMHDDCMGCTWTDADHWEPSAIDALADQIERVRALPVGPPSGGYYLVSMRDVRAALDGGQR